MKYYIVHDTIYLGSDSFFCSFNELEDYNKRIYRPYRKVCSDFVRWFSADEVKEIQLSRVEKIIYNIEEEL